jgi:hypothetical protein
MKIIRITNPIGVDYIKSYLECGEDFVDQESMAEQLKAILVESPATTFYLVAADDTQPYMFILAYIPPGKTYAVVFQLWVNKDFDPKQRDTLFLRLLLWCEQNEVTEVRMNDERNPKDLIDTWGFKPLKTIYGLNVVENVERVLIDGRATVLGGSNAVGS